MRRGRRRGRGTSCPCTTPAHSTPRERSSTAVSTEAPHSNSLSALDRFYFFICPRPTQCREGGGGGEEVASVIHLAEVKLAKLGLYTDRQNSLKIPTFLIRNRCSKNYK